LQYFNDALQEKRGGEISGQPSMPPLEGFPMFGFALMALDERQQGRFAAFATRCRNADPGGLNF
jgi:hypothetical protein